LEEKAVVEKKPQQDGIVEKEIDKQQQLPIPGIKDTIFN
jgi:hypothetical protein